MSEVNKNANPDASEPMELKNFRPQSGKETVTKETMIEQLELSKENHSGAIDAQSFEESWNNKSSDPPSSKMNWSRVAHKLREYNRKLLKKVFRLEQELADIDSKFTKYVEKSQNSDLLLAQQAKEIQQYQEKLAQLNQKLSCSQQEINCQSEVIQEISQQHEMSQKQAAQLERECTLLQEKYNHQSFELITKKQEGQNLKTKLEQQQRQFLEQEAELKRYQEAESARREKAVQRHKNYPHNRFVQPWSTSALPEPKIALSKTKSRSAVNKANQLDGKKTEAIKTAAKIATWSAAQKANQENHPQVSSSTPTKKPQSLAAVDLPTFPRP